LPFFTVVRALVGKRTSARFYKAVSVLMLFTSPCFL
jgi:hypothetical protein